MQNKRFSTFSFRARLIAVTLFAVLFFNAFIAVVIYFNVENVFSSYVENSNLKDSSDRAKQISNIFSESHKQLLEVSRDNNVRGFVLGSKPKEVEVRKIFEYMKLNSVYSTFSILDKSGTIVLSTEPTLEKKNFAFREYFKEAINGRQFSDVIISSVDNKLAFIISTPVIEKEEIVGVILARIKIESVFARMFGTQLENTFEYSFLLDEYGVVLYSNHPEYIFHTLGVPDANTQILIQRKWGPMGIDPTPMENFSIKSTFFTSYSIPETISVDNEGKKFQLSLVKTDNSPFFVLFASSGVIAEETIQQLTIPVIMYIALLAIFLSLVLFLLITEFLRPIMKIRSFVRVFSKENIHESIDVNEITDKDFKELAVEINAMAKNIKDSHFKLEDRVSEKTKELEVKVQELEESKRAMINVLEDLENSKVKVEIQKAQTTAVLESVEHAVVVVDPKGFVTYANQVAEHMFAMKSDTKKKFNEYIELKDFSNNPISLDTYILQYAIEEGKSTVLRSFVVQGKKTFPAFSIFSPIVFQDEIIGAVAVVRDITEEKKLEDVRISFISTAAHQLRTPLTAISWFSEMLLDEIQNTKAGDEKEMADQIYRSVRRMIDFVNILLQVARVEAGRVRVVPVSQSIRKLTEEIVDSIKPLILEDDKKTIHIRSLIDSDLLIPIDKEIYWQVVQNFLTNAIRYSDKGTTITVTLERKKNSIECSVHNFGMGIPEAEQSKIFQRFYRASNAVQAVPEGSGLGLALVKMLVEDWNGEVWFESDSKDGTTFAFTIPISGMKERGGEIGLAV